LWSNSIILQREGEIYLIKFNKLTGKTQYLTKKGWKDWPSPALPPEKNQSRR